MSVNNPLKYTGRTTHYNIPVFRPDQNNAGAGTTEAPVVSARAEQRAVNISDTQMYGNQRSLLGKAFASCVLIEGDFSEGSNSVTLSSIEAYIKGIYVNNEGNPITWNVTPGEESDLYIGLVESNRGQLVAQGFQSSREYGQITTQVIPVGNPAPNDNFLIIARVLI